MAVLVIEIIICIFYLVLLLMAAAKMRDIAEAKGWDAASLHVFAWCFFFPIFGYLYVIALPDLNSRQKNSKSNKKNNRKKISYQEDEYQEDEYQQCEVQQGEPEYWVCIKCGEMNSSDFSVCQKCNTYR